MWRVPRDRGATTYLAALVHKALVKHGWPATVQNLPLDWCDGFQVLHHETGLEAAPDFWQAVQIACRITARTYRVDIDVTDNGMVTILKEYTVTTSGLFKEKR